MKKKLISVVTACFNEEDNIEKLYLQVSQIMKLLPYSYEHIFIDNSSTDATVEKLKKLAKKDINLKLIVNTRNFGSIRSPYYGVIQSSGDACILIPSDFQVPPELIKEFIKPWEKGFKIVMAKKETSPGNSFMVFLKTKYYKFMNRIADVDILENCTGFGLFDKDVINILRKLDEPYPYFRGLLMEIGYPVAIVPYNEPKRIHGVTSYNFYSLYDYFMLGITEHSKLPLRIITMFGFLISILSLLVAAFFLITKLLFWDTFTVGVSPILIGMFFLGAVQFFFIGILGEYIGSIKTRQKNMPLVIERERVNFK